MSSTSSFDAVPLAPADPLFGLMARYKADTFDKKIDLGIGAYRDDYAKPWVLPVVKKAEAKLREDPEYNHEYLPIAGLPGFTSAAARLILGDESPAIAEKRVSSIQTISGTGAVHLGAAFLAKFHPRTVYLSKPTWANHPQIFSNCHISTESYTYYHAPTRGLDFEGFASALQGAPAGSVILLHACAHNPTGVDPTREQWIKIAEIMKAGKLFPFFDCAYQGFASGSLDNDAWAVRYFVEQGFELCIAQSFSKNLGLYGERAGCFHMVSPPSSNAQDATKRISSQLAIVQRCEISNPPAYGSRIADIVLNDPELFALWKQNLETMAGRIIEMRKALVEKLTELETPGDWSHVTKQIGMFSFTGLSEPQVAKLIEESHIYLTKNGRISMAGLNTHNIDYVARAIDRVVREIPSST
ncbi:pyridoxal phosphate-dependent transferase [Geopyxis carbonaria]|nr:pyridoxal phosphate-dependent transferase [Geopyxis carbonaria]